MLLWAICTIQTKIEAMISLLEISLIWFWCLGWGYASILGMEKNYMGQSEWSVRGERSPIRWGTNQCHTGFGSFGNPEIEQFKVYENKKIDIVKNIIDLVNLHVLEMSMPAYFARWLRRCSMLGDMHGILFEHEKKQCREISYRWPKGMLLKMLMLSYFLRCLQRCIMRWDRRVVLS